MDLKYKIRTYNFWISLSASVLIVLRLLGQSLGFEIDSSLFMDIATAVCGVLVVLGIIIMPTASVEKKAKKQDAEKDPQSLEDEGQETAYSTDLVELSKKSININIITISSV